ncbi:MAG: YlxM family DNA-binding protein [Christensenellales bacterium]
MDIEKKINIGTLYRIYGAFLTENQRAVTEMYFNMDMSLQEISEQRGISRQGVRDALLRAEEQLTEYESKLNLSAKFTRLSEGLEQVMRRAPEELKPELEKIAAILEE